MSPTLNDRSRFFWRSINDAVQRGLVDDEEARPRSRDTIVETTVGGEKGYTLDMETYVDRVVSSPLEFTSVFRIASSAPQARLIVKDAKGGTVSADDSFDARMKAPNPWTSRYDLQESTYFWLESTGNSFWVFDDIPIPGSAGPLPPFYMIRPGHMVILPDGKKRTYVHRTSPEQQGTPFKPDSVIHHRMLNPYSDLWGMPPQASLHDVLMTERFAAEHNTGFFRRGATVDGVLEYDGGTIHDDDYERIRREFAEKFGGVDRSHTPLILQGGLKWKQTGTSPKDMEFQGGRRANRETVYAAHGVPPALGGVFEYANYANAKIQYEFFWNECILPRLNKVAASLNLWLLVNGFPYEVEYDITDVPALQEQPFILSQRVVMLIQTGVITVNEGRLLLGMEGIGPAGDVTVEGASGAQLEALVSIMDVEAFVDPADVDRWAGAKAGGWAKPTTHLDHVLGEMADAAG